MFAKFIGAVTFALALSGGLAFAQPSSFDEPAELPPASFKGQQYVDSRGCVFLRAGFDGRVTWVPRVTRDRKQMCGGPVAATDTAAAAPEPAVTEAPMTAAPVARSTPAPKKTVRTVAAPVPAPPPGMRMACPASTPFLEQLRGPKGDSKLYCTRGDGTADGATLPRLIGAGKVVGHVSAVTISPPSDTLPVVPKGYVRAWKDDRLNPNRAKGTAEGEAAQDKVWSRKVPQDLTPEAKAAGVAKVAVGKIFVQVGSFAVASNADGAQGRLAAMGLPVARSKSRINGKAVQVVYAGPFATASDAQAALSAARRAGFSDAFIR
jgi:SPOR domain